MLSVCVCIISPLSENATDDAMEATEFYEEENEAEAKPSTVAKGSGISPAFNVLPTLHFFQLFSCCNMHLVVTQPNFDHLVDSTTSIHFIPSKRDHWCKMYGGGRNKVRLLYMAGRNAFIRLFLNGIYNLHFVVSAYL